MPPLETRRSVSAVIVPSVVCLVIGAAALSTALQGTPGFTAPPVGPQPVAPFAPSQQETEPAVQTPEPTAEPLVSPVEVGDLLQAIIIGVIVAVLLVGIIAVLRARRGPGRSARLGRGVGLGTGAAAVHVPALPDAEPTIIRRGIDGALAALRSDRTTSDAIIAAWIGLEEAAQDSGMRRGVAETPAEFAVRIIARTDGVHDAAIALLDRYQSVRFGGHIADESDRVACIAALETIREVWR